MIMINGDAVVLDIKNFDISIFGRFHSSHLSIMRVRNGYVEISSPRPEALDVFLTTCYITSGFVSCAIFF